MFNRRVILVACFLIFACGFIGNASSYEGLRAEVKVSGSVQANRPAVVSVVLHNDSGRNFILNQNGSQIVPGDTIGQVVIEDAAGPNGNYGIFDLNAVRATVLPHSSNVIAVAQNVVIPQCGNFIINADFLIGARSNALHDGDPAYIGEQPINVTLPVEASDIVRVSQGCRQASADLTEASKIR